MYFSTTTKPSSAGHGTRVRVLAATLSGLLLLALLGTVLALQKTIPGAATVVRLDGEGLFNLTNVWKIHLTFTSNQWQAMEPKGGPGGHGVLAARVVLAVRVILARACLSLP